MAMEGLGRLFDVAVGINPVDLNVAAVTGKWVSLKRSASLTVVFVHAKGTAGAGDNTLTLQQATSSAGAGAANLASIDHYYRKVNATAIDNSETWTRVAQTAAATIVEATGQGAADAVVWAFEVHGVDLSDGFTHINVSAAKVSGTTTPELGVVLYLPHDLEVQRTPANLAAANA